LAHLPNLKVDKLTSKFDFEGDKQRINSVLEAPPREDLKIFVNVEFLNGTC